MWCPNCKNEYINGKIRCADCGTELVKDLKENSYSFAGDSFPMPDSKDACLWADGRESPAITDSEENFAPPDETGVPESHAYISKRTKQEDIRSTAYTFIFVSVAGTILLILFALGVIPLAMAGSMKVLISVVMGSLFFLFFIIGMRYFVHLKSAKEEAIEEDQLFKEVTGWYKNAYKAKGTDLGIDKNHSEEQLYFVRYERMKHKIKEKYPNLEEAFLDYIIDSLYAELFPSKNAD